MIKMNKRSRHAFGSNGLKVNLNRSGKLSDKLWTGLLAVILSGGMITGYAYEKSNSVGSIFDSNISLAKNVIAFVLLFVCFYIGIVVVCSIADRINVVNPSSKNGSCNFYIEKLRQRPFIVSLITLLIVYIPYVLCHFPIVLMGDSYDQILQGFNIPAYTSETIQLISENVTLNSHHPVVHTLLLHFFLMLGKTIYSYNLGAFLYAFANLLALLSVVSLTIKVLVKNNVKNRWILVLLLYFALTPHVQEYMFLCTKDTWFAVLLMLFYLLFFDFLKIRKKGIHYIILILVSLGIILFRNEGKYFIILSFVIFFVMNRSYRKKLLLLAGSVICFSIFYTSVLLPVNQISPGSSREMLSIPFQQTARYVKAYEDEVTAEEKEAIAQILDYDHLAELYNPNLADPVKSTYNKYADKDDLKKYISVWIKMGIKHPDIYITAFWNNKYQFLYPVFNTAQYYNYKGNEFYDLSYSEEMMNSVNDTGSSVGLDLHYPERFSKLRVWYENFLENAWDVPVLSCFKTTAFYVWGILLWGIYAIIRRRKKSFLCFVPMLIQMLICMAGPANGYYFRYMYPLAFCLPMIWLLCKLENDLGRDRENG